MDWLAGIFSTVQAWLLETLVQPAMFAMGMANLLEDAYPATAWFMIGVLQVLVLLAVIGPLQRWRPVETRGSPDDRVSIRVDMVYTLIHRLWACSAWRCFLRCSPGLTKALARCAPRVSARFSSTKSRPA